MPDGVVLHLVAQPVDLFGDAFGGGVAALGHMLRHGAFQVGSQCGDLFGLLLIQYEVDVHALALHFQSHDYPFLKV